ncbi:MAG: universal stress protein [Candidatus Binatia bacterium]
MPYKTILVHLNNERRAGSLLEYAMGIGERFESHLIGIRVFPAFRLTPPILMPFGKELAGRLLGEIRDEEMRIRLIFEQVTSGHSIVPEWRSVTTEKRPVADVLPDHAHAADVVIAAQADQDWGFSEILDCPDRLAIESGRPVLVMPNESRIASPPRTVLVAWNGRREAARAVFDALPILALAKAVEVVTIDEQPRDEASLPDTEIAAALARHGANVKVTKLIPREGSAAHEIRARAADLQADLLVMGDYGHSRLSEFVFGHATRYFLKEMPIPVLFSH